MAYHAGHKLKKQEKVIITIFCAIIDNCMLGLFSKKKNVNPYLIILLVSLFSTLLLWLPFIFRIENWFGITLPGISFLDIYRHFDGPLYIIVAKSLYNPEIISALKIETPLSPIYFAAHFPLYPILIASLSPILGYLKAMITATLIPAILFGWLFYYVIEKLKLSAKPLLLTIILLMVPRFLIIRSIGSPEPLFMLFILASLYLFKQKNFPLSAISGMLASTVKSPGILLFVAYAILFALDLRKSKKTNLQYLWFLLIPTGTLLVFLIQALQYGDLFAYFNSGDNLHLVFPYAVFNFSRSWIGTAWLEEILFWFAIYGLAVYTLFEKKIYSFAVFSLVFFTSLLFVAHRDISRYGLPLLPFAAIAFEKFLTSKKFLIVALILLPAIYLFSYNFMMYNLMPISDWSAYK